MGLPAGVPVIAVGSHDTASAVVGVPSNGPSAYISSGTWSLVGVELDAPQLTAAARDADFTNEAGVDGTTRFLKNVMGLWVLSECVREWGDQDLRALLVEADTLPAWVRWSTSTTPRCCRRVTCPVEWSPWRSAPGCRCRRNRRRWSGSVLDSLAAAYRRTVDSASTIAGVGLEVVHVVGGGSQNELLCQLTADACGLPVVAGPTEAAALGNVLVQARTLGEDLPDLASMRELVRRTQSLRRYEPTTGSTR